MSALTVAPPLRDFIDTQVLPGLDLGSQSFWDGFADLLERFAPANITLLAVRDRLQAQIDAWHFAQQGEIFDPDAYEAFLREIGYLADAPAPFTITTRDVDDELARRAGPQLVVPALNARFLLNAANARWGSLYDALYGSDVLGPPPPAGPYDPLRGAAVISRAKSILDEHFPLVLGRHADVTAYRIEQDAFVPALRDPAALAGWTGDAAAPSAVLLKHNGLHVELSIDRSHPIGKTDPAGLADVVVEAALSTIVDLEDSIAAVDAGDKVAAYANWLGLIRGDLTATFEKDGKSVQRTLNADRVYSAPGGRTITLKGRSLLFVRNVGHLMTTPAVRLVDGSEAPEGLVDAVITSLIALHDLKRVPADRNSRAGSIYIVKPKMHGHTEVSFADRVFDAVEDLLELPRHTIKLGLMDEERRTSANLAACINAVKDRLVFINTGFLDRTGDEIHTSMHAGPMVRKAEMRAETWIKAYEDRNVRIGLACGLGGRGQIGKGMWAAPDKMADMVAQKIGHPKSGANTAWVPSPTAATLHALHYHEVDVFSRQAELAAEPIPPLRDLLTLPLATTAHWSETEVREELDNNVQGILGYVVRWIDQGIGCSKVPDIRDVGLMEDRATLRISSQHIANWLMHEICTAEDVDASLRRMVAKVDAQNAGDANYRPMSAGVGHNLAFLAARALIFDGVTQPNGYTEPLLHRFRTAVKTGIRVAPT